MPSGSSAKKKSPLPVAVVVRVKPVDALSSLTTACGSAAPEESVTLPLKLPRNVCAYALAAKIPTKPNLEIFIGLEYKRNWAAVQALQHRRNSDALTRRLRDYQRWRTALLSKVREQPECCHYPQRR